MKSLTWAEAGQLCCDQLPRVLRPLPLAYWGARADFPARCEFLFAEHERLRLQTESAIERFAKQGDWPELPPGSLNYLVSNRLLCALDTVNILLAADDRHRLVADPAAFDRETVLRWLLRETWHGWRWDTWLKLAVLRSLHPGQDSFYGVPPVTPSPLN